MLSAKYEDIINEIGNNVPIAPEGVFEVRHGHRDKMIFKRPCPICAQNEVDLLADLNFARVDQFQYNPRARLGSCRVCGLAYNEVADPAELTRHYGRNPIAPLPIGEDEALVRQVVGRHLAGAGGLWVDVGCGTGELLIDLKNNGFDDLLGLEVSPGKIEYVRSRNIRAEVFAGRTMPLNDQTAGVISFRHVLEHVYQPEDLLLEAHRALKEGGLIYLEVPDAGRYGASPASDCFQWLCWGHVNHFDEVRLGLLLAGCGFELIDSGRKLEKRMDDYPSVWVVGRRTRSAGRVRPPAPAAPDRDSLKAGLEELIEKNFRRTAPLIKAIDKLADDGVPVWLWALSTNFMYFYGNSSLRRANIRGLIDSQPRYSGLTLDSRAIQKPEALKSAAGDETVLLFSHRGQGGMKSYLRDMGFSGSVVVVA
ncbi:class I SAM-dependent methyltransferase [Deltaproteobacteria bacterium OttesenSCG-928-K17]|nr:class I SAM-dependent methyltransferase [Deltaproteobacteria bacterium OttesenSCG-928-K17]